MFRPLRGCRPCFAVPWVFILLLQVFDLAHATVAIHEDRAVWQANTHYGSSYTDDLELEPFAGEFTPYTALSGWQLLSLADPVWVEVWEDALLPSRHLIVNGPSCRLELVPTCSWITLAIGFDYFTPDPGWELALDGVGLYTVPADSAGFVGVVVYRPEEDYYETPPVWELRGPNEASEPFREPMLALDNLSCSQYPNVPDPHFSTVSIAASAAGASVFVLPSGEGTPLTAARAPGGALVDATITVTLFDQVYNAIPGYPRELVWLESWYGGVAFPAGGTAADHDTDSLGRTTWTQPLMAGGCESQAMGVVVWNPAYWDGGPAWLYPEIPLLLNSPDMNGDLVVDELDLEIFTAHLSGSYSYCADFNFDGDINLLDVQLFSPHFAPSGYGTVVVLPEPETYNPWWQLSSIQHSESGCGPATFPDLPAGLYTMSWSKTFGWNPAMPAAETLRLTADATLTFTATVAAATVEDRMIAGWGDDRFSQSSMPAVNSDFVRIAAGANHSLGLKQDGVVVAWGDDSSDQCTIPSPNSDFVEVAAGRFHSLGLKSDGTIVAWGSDFSGQCTLDFSNQDFVAVAAGGAHSLGLQRDGTVLAWGSDADGQCDVPQPNEGFVGIAAGEQHSVAWRQDGSVVAWGANTSGQCEVPQPNVGFIAVSAGVSHNLGLRSDGSIVEWGEAVSGPGDVPEPNTDFVAVAAGGDHNLGLKSNGEVIAWGASGGDDFGQCCIPVLGMRAIAIAAGEYHSLAILGGEGSIVSAPPLSPDPSRLALTAVKPNPFNPSTSIHFDVPLASDLTIAVYDLRGRLIRTLWRGTREAGRHHIEWDGLDSAGKAAPSGVYLIRLANSEGESRTAKVTLAK